LQSHNLKIVIKAVKALILCIIHNPNYPHLLMHVFNFVVPKQKESHALKKVMFYYWEIVEKTNKENGKLKQEFLLICNHFRNHLLHANEYIRGKMLRLLSRIMHSGVLESLTPSILKNLKHKHSYVRRNAVSCLY